MSTYGTAFATQYPTSPQGAEDSQILSAFALRIANTAMNMMCRLSGQAAGPLVMALVALTPLTPSKANAQDWSGRFLAPSSPDVTRGTISALLAQDANLVHLRAGAASEEVDRRDRKAMPQWVDQLFGNAEAVFAFGPGNRDLTDAHITEDTLAADDPHLELGIRVPMGANSDLVGAILGQDQRRGTEASGGYLSGLSLRASFRF